MNERDLERALAVLLGSRRKAKQLLERTTLRHLAEAPESELARFMPGRDARRRFRAALRLARDVLSPPPRNRLESTESAYAHLYPYLAGREAERFVVVACNIRHQAIATTVIAEGAPDAVNVRPADVFAVAIRHRATAVVVGHNHPSEIVKPSSADRELTLQLVEAGKVLLIPVLDHLIVCGQSFWSLVHGTHGMSIRLARAERSKP